VHYSGVNYKDALAATGKGKILKKFPLNAGIDLSGVVESSSDDRFSPGDQVLVNGCGLGENHDGGLAEYARVPADWVIPLPDGLTLREAMVLGTAGFTAALAIYRMQHNEQSPEQGPIVVSGATGGVGSIAISMLASLGYQVIALTSRDSFKTYLTELGADQVCSLDDLSLGDGLLEKSRFAGVIDNLGGDSLAKLITHVKPWGNVASIGLADGQHLNSSVFPFILRGISLLGASSTNCPMTLRQKIWQQMGQQLKPKSLDKILMDEVPLSQVSPVFNELLDRQRYGRTVINCLRN